MQWIVVQNGAVWCSEVRLGEKKDDLATVLSDHALMPELVTFLSVTLSSVASHLEPKTR